jgi:hypothetical protein
MPPPPSRRFSRPIFTSPHTPLSSKIPGSSPTATGVEATVKVDHGTMMLTGARFDMERIDTVDNGGVLGSPSVAEQSPRDERKVTARPDGIVPNLARVSETMLWSLHNRANEAGRPASAFVDPESVRIQRAINYDFTRHFGVPLGSLAARAAEIDRALRSWLDRHPEGIIVSLGEGLETQSAASTMAGCTG